MAEQRWFIDWDGRGEPFLIPEEKRGAWEEWAGLEEDGFLMGEVPRFAIRLPCPVRMMTFEKPSIDGEEV